MPAETAYHDDLELDSIEEDPDLPLPPPDTPHWTARWLQQHTPHWTARWLQQHTPHWTRRWLQQANGHMDALRPRWLESRQPSSYADQTAQLLRPRLTVGYVCCSILALYVLYCCLVGSPLFASKLPQYTGRFDVGAVDIEVPAAEPRNIVDTVFKQGAHPAFRLDTVLFTLYYPAAKGSRSSHPRHKWFPKPISLVAEGYAQAARFNNFFSRPLFTLALWGLASSIEIPAKVDVPLLEASTPDADEGELSRFPVVVLSHGDVSSRTDYTAYCGELASRGIVVAAIEHRDGSCPGSIVHLPHGKTKRVLLSRADQLKPDNAKEEVTNDEWRFQKLAFRDAEIHEIIGVLQDLDLGKGQQVFSHNYRKEGKNLHYWKSRLDFSHLVIAGHSFGATGALQALKSANKSTAASSNYHNPAVGGIIFDPGKSSGQLNTDIDVPILVVHSDSWSKAHTIFYGRPHFDTVRDIAREVLDRTGASWFMTSLKTSHPSCTDAPLIEPLLLSWTTGATINVREGLREYVRVSLEFLAYLRHGKRRGVLDIGSTHESYGNDTRSSEQMLRIPAETMRYWEVHVAPPASFEGDEEGILGNIS